MTATLALKPPDTVAAVHDAAAVKTAAAAEVARLTLRLTQIEARAWATRAERQKHQQQITEALLADGAMPKAREPVVIEPDAALKVVRDALKEAEQALVAASGDHRAAICHHVEQRRAEVVATYREAFQHYTDALRSLAAYDRILSRTGIQTTLSNLVHSRLQVPALRHDPDAVQGLALEGRHFLGSPLLDEREREARAALESEVGCGLPF